MKSCNEKMYTCISLHHSYGHFFKFPENHCVLQCIDFKYDLLEHNQIESYVINNETLNPGVRLSFKATAPIELTSSEL